MATTPTTTSATTSSPSPSHGVERVWARNLYYLHSYHRMVFIFLLILFLIVGLICFSIYLSNTPPTPKYFPTTPDGKPIKMEPLNKPLQTTEFVENWTIQQVLILYSFDYITYRKALQDASTYFTPLGHMDFISALKASTNLEAVTAKKQVVSSEVTGPAKVTREGQVTPEVPYTWDLEIPLTITYQNSESEKKEDIIRQKGAAIVRVSRGSTLRYVDGIAIAQLVFEVR